MVTKLLFALVMLACLSQNVDARTIRALKIEKTGLDFGKDLRNPPDMCKTFKPTRAQVKRFFEKAYPIPDIVVTKDRYTPCHATGTIEFSDGFAGTWIVYSAGTAVLEFDFGGSTALFYKDRRWYDPTACTYGNDLPHDC